MELPSQEGAVFTVRVKPNAHRTTYLGWDAARTAHTFSLAAIPDKGKANKELLDFLKREHGLLCEIVSGHASRKKILRITRS